MAEGRTNLNQQVVDTGYWTQDTRAAMVDRPWAMTPGVAERESNLEAIRQAVESEIVPRVAAGLDRSSRSPGGIAHEDVLRFVRVLLNHDDEATVSAHVAAVQEHGVSFDDIYLNLFQPAARHIGELWCDDLCSFVDVTLAVGTMQKLLRTFGPMFHREGRPEGGARQALIVPLPGDQHTFGLSMVGEFLRRAGWGVWTTPFVSGDMLSETLGKLWFAVVGFSASTEDRLDELAAVIRRTRRDSCNTNVRIMVGGPLFVAQPDHVHRVGADAMGTDAVHALSLAESFVAAAVIGPARQTERHAPHKRMGDHGP